MSEPTQVAVRLPPRHVSPEEDRLLQKLRDLDFGTIEVVKSFGRITEIRTTQKERFEPT